MDPPILKMASKSQNGCARLILQPAGRLTETERDTLDGVLKANPLLARGYRRNTHV
jgi:hypothetical protein